MSPVGPVGPVGPLPDPPGPVGPVIPAGPVGPSVLLRVHTPFVQVSPFSHSFAFAHGMPSDFRRHRPSPSLFARLFWQ
jgi:hypothetical protein